MPSMVDTALNLKFSSHSVMQQGDERLLKLYESGLPAWAIYAPQYGMWYRPWMRSITYMLFILVSAFSLVMGFYDLYKNVPYLDEVSHQIS